MKSSLQSVVAGLLAVSVSCFSCDNNRNTTAETDSRAAAGQPDTGAAAGQDTKAEGFDISRLPVATQDLGAFPYLPLPESFKELNPPIVRDADLIYFPIEGSMTPLEGKVWKANITTKSGKSDEWSLPIFEKRFDAAIKALGAVKIFDGTISKEEYDRYHGEASYLGEDGSIGYANQPIKVYAIHRPDEANIYIQLAGYSAGGYLNILQQQPE